MKYLLLPILALFFCAAANYYAPKRSEQFHLLVIADRLVFPSIADYRKVVDQPDTELKSIFLQKVQSLDAFHSLNSSPGSADGLSALIHDDYFKSILNRDLVVQIGANIFKVNPKKKRVFALKASLPDQYNDLLAENEANPNIRVFSTDQNVLDIIENPAVTASVKNLCSESGIGSYDKSTGSIPVSGGLNMAGKLHFNRFGIYYSLFAEVGTENSSVLQLSIDLEPVQYHARCGITNGPYNIYDYQSNNATWKYQKYQSYQGSKNLNKVYFRGRFRAKINGTMVKESPWIQIKVNY